MPSYRKPIDDVSTWPWWIVGDEGGSVIEDVRLARATESLFARKIGYTVVNHLQGSSRTSDGTPLSRGEILYVGLGGRGPTEAYCSYASFNGVVKKQRETHLPIEVVAFKVLRAAHGRSEDEIREAFSRLGLGDYAIDSSVMRSLIVKTRARAVEGGVELRAKSGRLVTRPMEWDARKAKLAHVWPDPSLWILGLPAPSNPLYLGQHWRQVVGRQVVGWDPWGSR